MRPLRPLAASLLAAALPATLAVAAPSTLPTAGAAPAGPPVVLTAPETVTVTSYRGNWIYDTLGVRATAPDQPFEVWSHRATYDDPITGEWRSGGLSGALPDGAMTSFSELSRFYSLRVRRADGSVAARRTLGACLNDGNTRNGPGHARCGRRTPSGAPTTPTPSASVMGIQQGWARRPSRTGRSRCACGPAPTR